MKGVHKIIPAEREWLSVLSAINALGQTIPNYYIFKGVRKLRNYTALCEEGAMLGMQKKGWMDTFHFIEWMDYFIHKMQSEENLFQERRHLIILDGHKSHISLEVLMKARDHGIDMISLPSHTSHELQPLDKACFRPFKVAFKAYRDLWIQKNGGQKCRKEDLAQWASLALKKALTPENISARFRATRIWPLNPAAMTLRTEPSETFVNQEEDLKQREEILAGDLSSSEEGVVHYYGSEMEVDDDVQEEDLEYSQSPVPVENDHISKFLKLPTTSKKTRNLGRAEPLVDYSQSQLLTSEQHLCNLEDIATRKERVQKEKEKKLKERKLNKAKKAEQLELNKIKRSKAKEVKQLAKDLKEAQQAQKKN